MHRELDSAQQPVRMPIDGDGGYLLHLYVDEAISPVLMRYCIAGENNHFWNASGHPGGRLCSGSGTVPLVERSRYGSASERSLLRFPSFVIELRSVPGQSSQAIKAPFSSV
jgi:hypothetical protein